MKKSFVIKIWSVLLLFLFLPLDMACSGGGGNSVSGPSGVSGTTFEGRIANYKAAYGKSDEWENWMLANKGRYEAAFFASSAKPATMTISFQYETTPINYNPAWSSEAKHMNVLATMAEGAYPGYNFNFVFEDKAVSSYANVIAGIATNNSFASGKTVFLYYETIFNHEFGHTMNILHHYDSTGDIGKGKHM